MTRIRATVVLVLFGLSGACTDLEQDPNWRASEFSHGDLEVDLRARVGAPSRELPYDPSKENWACGEGTVRQLWYDVPSTGRPVRTFGFCIDKAGKIIRTWGEDIH